MASFSYGKIIEMSFNRTVLILFRPFSLKKWLFLVLIALLSGALGGGGNTNFSNYSNPKTKSASAVIQYASALNLSNIDSGKALRLLKGNLSKRGHFFASGFTVLLFTSLIIVFIALLILFTWLGARFKFIWYNSIVENDASVSGPFSRYKDQGDSLFNFLLLFMAVMIGFLVIIGLWIFASGTASGIIGGSSSPNFLGFITTFIVPLLILFALIIILSLAMALVDHFVVPIMAMDKCKFKSGVNTFVGILKTRINEFLIFILILIGLGIAAAIAAIFILVICIVIGLLAAGILFGLPYLLMVSVMGLGSGAYFIYCFIVGIPFAAVFILMVWCSALPFAVFFRCLSLYFLSSLDCGYQPLALEN
ncbi:MAG: hypothetical protein JW867_04160 [Candidatus Omnitrophica bacterium]|nr:hypothetical protein [Candidatus Omnitrophota bacterium]